MSEQIPVTDHSGTENDDGTTVHGPLTQSVRALIDATIRTEAGADKVARARDLVEEATWLLSGSLVPGSFGVRQAQDGRRLPWGNAAIGLRNPIAPPLTVRPGPDGSVWCVADLGAAYEGPPGCVHGGIAALVLDQVLSATAHRPGEPAVTGTLTVRYLLPLPLGRIRAEAQVQRHEEAKTFATGRITVGGEAAVIADGVFIRPRPRF
ncbi:PaaI family thioesterase [Nocardia neocaledoniensis]|uniref:PaaI family thioesterase n=1 Tax=Nocardia neocaledoniensis TaxID=236511 RepID=UPI002455BC6B|nr:PaaI family thioesterase [Nocardia neocaledoniensis]